jgi:DNA-binding NarL/FixJ family response regulator
MRVLRAGINDRSLKEIAALLILSRETVKTHRSGILRKWLLLTEQTKAGQRAYRSMIREVSPYLAEPPATAPLPD